MEISAKNARVRPCFELQIRNIESNCWFITQMYMFLLTIRQQRAHKKWTYWKNKLTPNRLKIQKISSYKHSSPKCVRASWHYYRKKIQMYMYTLGTLPSSSHYFNHGTVFGRYHNRTSEQRIQWSWAQIPLRSTFYSYLKESFSGEYHMYYLIPLHSSDTSGKIWLKQMWRLVKAMAEIKCDTK